MANGQNYNKFSFVAIQLLMEKKHAALFNTIIEYKLPNDGHFNINKILKFIQSVTHGHTKIFSKYSQSSVAYPGLF